MTLKTIVSDLLSYTPTTPHEMVTVLGYHESGDGGGGNFYWAETATVPANGGTIFNVSGAAGRWKRCHSEASAVNVKWFGAKGDDNNDDTAAIQSAFDLQKSIFFPEGRYCISNTLNIRLDYGTIHGHSAFLQPTGSITALNLAGYNFQYAGLHISYEKATVIDENAVAIWFFKNGTRPVDQVMNSVLSDFSILHAHTGIKSSDATGATWQTEIRNIYMDINPGLSLIKAIGIDLAGPITGADNTTLKISKVSVQDFHSTPGAGIRGIRIIGYSDVSITNVSCDFVTQTSTSEGEVMHIVANQIIIKGIAHESITNTINLETYDAAPIVLVGGLGNTHDSVTIDDCLFINSKFNCGGPNASGSWITFKNNPRVTIGNIVNKFVGTDDGTQISKLNCALYRGRLNSIGNVNSTEIAYFDRNANNCVILPDYSGEVKTTAPIAATAVYTLLQPALCCLIAVKGFDSTNGLISFYEIISVATAYGGTKFVAVVSSNKINYSHTNTYSVDANNNLVLTRSGGNIFTVFAKTISTL